ncbi:MAG: TetR/AcrR family transcriptional regulator [Dietzia sp.]
MSKRDEARAETVDRILMAARGEIARVGGVGLSMRSVAREAGMVSSAIYRYFPSREDLLTAMILESYRGLAGALRAAEASDAAADSDSERWCRLARALRDWGLRAPHEFQLIYGTPIPGYVAPAETIPAAGEVAAPFLGCPGTRRVPGFEPSTGSSGLHALGADVGIAPSAAAAVVAAISELVGFVGHELAGHFVGLADPADDLYRAVVERQVRDLGLDQPGGRSAPA